MSGPARGDPKGFEDVNPVKQLRGRGRRLQVIGELAIPDDALQSTDRAATSLPDRALS
jgi:hypothetical protein